MSGRLDSVPCLEFQGRKGIQCDLRGEKLTDGFVREVLNRGLERLGLGGGTVFLAPKTHEKCPHYVLFHQGIDPSDAGALTAECERLLSENPHYELCRRLRQLGPLVSETLTKQGWRAFEKDLMQGGRRPGDWKPSALVMDDRLVHVMSTHCDPVS